MTRAKSYPLNETDIDEVEKAFRMIDQDMSTMAVAHFKNGKVKKYAILVNGKYQEHIWIGANKTTGDLRFYVKAKEKAV